MTSKRSQVRALHRLPYKDPDLPSLKKRSLAKTVTHRIISSALKFGAFYAITGSLEFGGLLTAAEAGIGVVVYYTHERLWKKIKWGKI